MDPDPAIFVLDFQDAIKKRIRIQETEKHTDPTDPDPHHWLGVLWIRNFLVWYCTGDIPFPWRKS
jgi:hypothetical protein